MSCNLLYLLLAAIIGHASARSTSQLVGAEDADPNEFPYTVSLQIDNDHFCGGCIISEYHILTAAHCIDGFDGILPLSELTVLTGTNFLLKGGQVHRVAAVYPHPRYLGNISHPWYNDIGVIKLEEPIHFNKAQNKVDLPTSPPPENVYADATGWGYTSYPPTHVTYFLQKLSLRVIPFEECKKHHGDDVHSNMICTLNERDIGTCSGDSGGPLVYDHKVIGVVSGGDPCALGVPDIFSNVYVALPFIHEAMKK